MDAERNILLPGIVGQLEFIRDQWIEVQQSAQRPNVHVDLAFALVQVMPPKEGADPDASAREYFTEVAHQAQQMLDVVDEVLRARPENPDVLSAWAWLSRAWGAASVVLRNRRLLFWKKLRSFATIRNSVTGEITAKPLPQVEWVVFPFDTIVDEACRVAEAIQHNVDDWKAELRKGREALLEHATARRSEAAARWTLWSQIVVTLLAIILVVVGIQATDWFTKRQELETTKVRLEATTAELERQRAENKTARARIDELERNLAALNAAPAQASPAPKKRPSRSP
jgi:hypothetical protein